MRKLALDDDILLNIEKPARYIGHEVNSVMKDKKAVDIRFLQCVFRRSLRAENKCLYHTVLLSVTQSRI